MLLAVHIFLTGSTFGLMKNETNIRAEQKNRKTKATIFLLKVA